MEVVKTAIEGLCIIEPRVFGDARGYFFESFNAREFAEKTRLQVKSVCKLRGGHHQLKCLLFCQ